MLAKFSNPKWKISNPGKSFERLLHFNPGAPTTPLPAPWEANRASSANRSASVNIFLTEKLG